MPRIKQTVRSSHGGRRPGKPPAVVVDLTADAGPAAQPIPDEAPVDLVSDDEVEGQQPQREQQTQRRCGTDSMGAGYGKQLAAGEGPGADKWDEEALVELDDDFEIQLSERSLASSRRQQPGGDTPRQPPDGKSAQQKPGTPAQKKPAAKPAPSKQQQQQARLRRSPDEQGSGASAETAVAAQALAPEAALQAEAAHQQRPAKKQRLASEEPAASVTSGSPSRTLPRAPAHNSGEQRRHVRKRQLEGSSEHVPAQARSSQVPAKQQQQQQPEPRIGRCTFCFVESRLAPVKDMATGDELEVCSSCCAKNVTLQPIVRGRFRRPSNAGEDMAATQQPQPQPQPPQQQQHEAPPSKKARSSAQDHGCTARGSGAVQPAADQPDVRGLAQAPPRPTHSGAQLPAAPPARREPGSVPKGVQLPPRKPLGQRLRPASASPPEPVPQLAPTAVPAAGAGQAAANGKAQKQAEAVSATQPRLSPTPGTTPRGPSPTAGATPRGPSPTAGATPRGPSPTAGATPRGPSPLWVPKQLSLRLPPRRPWTISRSALSPRPYSASPAPTAAAAPRASAPLAGSPASGATAAGAAASQALVGASSRPGAAQPPRRVPAGLPPLPRQPSAEKARHAISAKPRLLPVEQAKLALLRQRAVVPAVARDGWQQGLTALHGHRQGGASQSASQQQPAAATALPDWVLRAKQAARDVTPALLAAAVKCAPANWQPAREAQAAPGWLAYRMAARLPEAADCRSGVEVLRLGATVAAAARAPPPGALLAPAAVPTSRQHQAAGMDLGAAAAALLAASRPGAHAMPLRERAKRLFTHGPSTLRADLRLRLAAEARAPSGGASLSSGSKRAARAERRAARQPSQPSRLRQASGAGGRAASTDVPHERGAAAGASFATQYRSVRVKPAEDNGGTTKYETSASIGGKQLWLGTYDTLDAAVRSVDIVAVYRWLRGGADESEPPAVQMPQNNYLQDAGLLRQLRKLHDFDSLKHFVKGRCGALTGQRKGQRYAKAQA